MSITFRRERTEDADSHKPTFALENASTLRGSELVSAKGEIAFGGVQDCARAALCELNFVDSTRSTERAAHVQDFADGVAARDIRRLAKSASAPIPATSKRAL